VTGEAASFASFPDREPADDRLFDRRILTPGTDVVYVDKTAPQ